MSHVAANDAVEREYLSPREFAVQTGLSSATVNRYLAGGRIPFHQPGGPRCRILIPRSALEPFTAAPTGAQQPSSEKQPPTSAKPRSGPKPRWKLNS